MGRKRSDPYIRAQAVALYNAGYNQVDISKQWAMFTIRL